MSLYDYSIESFEAVMDLVDEISEGLRSKTDINELPAEGKGAAGSAE